MTFVLQRHYGHRQRAMYPKNVFVMGQKIIWIRYGRVRPRYLQSDA
jgi:hypothetical protein